VHSARCHVKPHSRGVYALDPSLWVLILPDIQRPLRGKLWGKNPAVTTRARLHPDQPASAHPVAVLLAGTRRPSLPRGMPSQRTHHGTTYPRERGERARERAEGRAPEAEGEG
jgi:hypothetical protein